MADTFALWDEVKAYAKRYADSSRPLPLDAEAIIRSRHVDAGLRKEALEFYAMELCAMIRDFRQERLKEQAS